MTILDDACTGGLREYNEDLSDTGPGGTCIDCGRLLIDPTGLYCAACQPDTVPLEEAPSHE